MTTSQHRVRRQPNGYIALIAVLIVTAVTLAIGLSLNLLSIGEAQSGLLDQQREQGLALANGCADEALLQLERDSGYAGGTLSFGQGSCTIGVAAPQPTERTVTVTSEIGDVQRTVALTLMLTNGTATITSWQQ